jgi:ATP-binding cassette subfamily B protein
VIRPRIVADGLRVDKALRFVWQAAPKWTLLSTALVIIQGAVPLLTLYILKVVVDRLASASVLDGAPGTFASLLVPLSAALAVAILGTLCNALLGHASAMQAHLVADRMQSIVQAKSVEVDLEYYENAQFFDKLHRAQREAPSRPVRIVQGLVQVGRSGLTLVGAIVVLLQFHWSVVVAILAASIPVMFYRLRHAEAVHALHLAKTSSERLSNYYNDVITTADYAKEVRVFGFGPVLAARFADLRRGIRQSLRQISAKGYRQQFVTESVATFVGFCSLAVIAHAAWNRSITLGELVMYFGASQVALGALRPTLGGLAEAYENNLFLSALFEFLSVPKKVVEPAQPAPMPRPWRMGIAVEQLSFRYPGTERLVLDGIDMAISPGQVVALVGRNGSGKTTLSKLLCRLYDPTAGRITIDGVDLRSVRTDDLRREIGVIHQDFGRYQLSVRENVALGLPEMKADESRIVAAASAAGIHDDLVRLRKGYDTLLGRTLAAGEELSVGQWQKLALARTLVRNSQLILLDEPTSALDPAAEFDFFRTFRATLAGRSALVISHRFSTVRLADRIYVLDRGRIVEQGTHDELLALDGLYALLFRRQASYYREAGTSPQ